MTFFSKSLLTALLIFFAASAEIFSQLPAAGNDAGELEIKAEAASGIWNREKLIESADLFQNAAKTRIHSNNQAKASENLINAGRIFIILGENEKALSLFEQAFRFSDAVDDANGKTASLGEIALIELKKGRSAIVAGKLRKAKSLINNSVNPDNQAFIHYVDSEFLYYEKSISKCIEALNLAVELSEKSHNARDEAKYLLNLAYAFMAADDNEKSLDILEKALEKWNSISDTRGIAFTQIALGYAYSNNNQKQKSIESYKLAESLFPPDIDLLERARIYNGIGRTYEEFGEWQLSLDYRKKAFELFGKANHILGQTATIPSIVVLTYLTEPENEDVVLKNFDQAIRLTESAKDSYHYAIVKEELANYYFRIGDNEKAIQNYRQPLAYFHQTKLFREIPLIKTKLAQIAVNKNQLQTARENLSEALDFSLLVKDKFSESEILYNLAKLDLLENEKDKSLEKITASLSLIEMLYSDVASSKLRQSYFSNVFDQYEFYINLSINISKQTSDESYSVKALQAAEKSRARSMLENLSLSEANFMKDANPETVGREKEIRNLLNLKADKLTDLLSQNVDKSEIDRISREINDLENELENIKAELKENSPIYSAIKNPAPFDVAEFQQNVLDDNSLLLEFSFGKTESYLWLIGKNEFASYVLPPREQIEEKIQKLRELLASREMLRDETAETFQTRIAQTEKEYSSLASELSRDLFGQVAGKFGDKKLIIVPDGKLGVFPAAALPFPNSETNEPILLSNEVVYEPSASTLSLIAKFGKQAKSPTKSLLIFSDPVFSTDDNRLSGKVLNDNSNQSEKAESFRFVESLNSLERLKSSKTEADSIIDILGKSGVESFSGFSANRERLLNTDVGDYKILHFATHGIIDENRPELSGIVLSRFDENGRKMDEFFRLHDIYGMNLNSDLVVLSACYTGVGKEVKGEGLMSLNNAFLSVGAKTVLSSLWKVEDGATLELMKNFYEAMTNEHLTPSKALQKAQIKMLKSERYKSPFYWAAFTVQGDFRNVPQISGGGVWKYFLPMPVILLFGAFWGLRVIRRRNRM